MLQFSTKTTVLPTFALEVEDWSPTSDFGQHFRNHNEKRLVLLNSQVEKHKCKSIFTGNSNCLQTEHSDASVSMERLHSQNQCTTDSQVWFQRG